MCACAQGKEIEALKYKIKSLYEQRKSTQDLPPVTLKYRTRSSYTTRAKTYKNCSHGVDCGYLNRVLNVDVKRKIALVEARVTMEQLVQETLRFGLTPMIVPEIKDITVGGAILGMAAESGSHRYGCFNDICNAYELITAEGNLIRASPVESEDLYYAVPGSYGSFGVLTSAEIQLVPAKKGIHLRYHVFSTPQEAVKKLLNLSKDSESADFLDGIILKKDLAVVIEGNLIAEIPKNLPQFSAESATTPYYYQHVQQVAENHSTGYEEWMSHYDYFFRYDPGAFWVGPYLFHFPLLLSLLFEGVLKWRTRNEGLSESEVKRFYGVPNPNFVSRVFLKSLTSCKTMCKLLHRAENWVRKRFVIQDFCIPDSNAFAFLESVSNDPAIYPMWLLPIKSTSKPQIFAPHKTDDTSKNDFFLNFGIYGLPAYSGAVPNITRKLEGRTKKLGGRKVLYSHSYYTPEEFWGIYPRAAYETLRAKTAAKGFWVDITDKVLSQ